MFIRWILSSSINESIIAIWENVAPGAQGQMMEIQLEKSELCGVSILPR